jgi:ligand-binding SRPBCC domain-containing protein
MATIHQINREVIVKTDLQTAWEFMSSPKNLDLITPDDMSFEIVTQVPQKMYNGLLIEYRVGIPLIGKQTWVSEIKYIQERHSFVDEQRVGPYKMWYHYHEITEVAAGIRFLDQVNYVVPFGPLGAIAQTVYIRKQLQHVFDYRSAAMLRHFG